jgi:hypothetical protein
MGYLQRKMTMGLLRALADNYPACFPFPLHFTMAKGPICLPIGQQRLGVPEVRTMKRESDAFKHHIQRRQGKDLAGKKNCQQSMDKL